MTASFLLYGGYMADKRLVVTVARRPALPQPLVPALTSPAITSATRRTSLSESHNCGVDTPNEIMRGVRN